MSRLGAATSAAGLAALGVSAVLAWTYAVSLLLPSCPSQEGGVVVRLITLPLGEAGVLLWALLLVVASKGLVESWGWLAVSALAAGFSSILVGDPFLLAMLSAAYVVLAAFRNLRRCLEAVAAGVVAVEALSIAYLLARAYAVKLPLPPALPYHLSLYCPLTVVAPLIVLATALAPLGALALERKSKVYAPTLGRLGLLVGLATCILLWLVIYASALNPGVELIGVDSVTRYYPHAITLLEGGLPSVISIGYDRPLYYLFLYSLATALGPFEAVKALPLFSLILHTLSSYAAARELAGRNVAALASALAPLTYTATAGLFGGLFSNWTALSTGLFSVAFLSRWLKQGKARWLALHYVMLVVTVATHIYMGAVFFASTSLSLSLFLISKKYRRRALAALTLQLALAALGFYLADSAAAQLGFRSPSNVVSALTRSWWSRVQKSQLFSPAWWRDFSFNVYEYAATAALDPTVWLLTAVGIASPKPSELCNPFLAPWLIVVYLLSVTAPFELMWRSLYDYPFSLSEALGLAYILSLIAEKAGERAALLWLAAIIFFKLSYTLAFTVGLAA
ncbi:MAG: hypothetical protein QXQ60_04805 [Thermofilum sp.]